MQKLNIAYAGRFYEVEEGAKGLLYAPDGHVFEKTKYDSYALYAEPRYLVYRGNKYKVIKHKDGLWRFEDGTIADLEEDGSKADKKVRCGVGYFSLDEDHKLTDACRPHDHAYSSPAYQALHTRSEADVYLKSLVKKIYPGVKGSAIGTLFRNIANLFGAALWEEKSTRNK